jgi:uncharacterized coiled-coil protein SlyX
MGDRQYLVSTASAQQLSAVFHVSEDDVRHLPQWRSTDMPLGLFFYGLNTNHRPDHAEDIARECIDMMMRPDDHHSAPNLTDYTSIVAALQDEPMATLMQRVMETQQSIDSMNTMLHDLGLSDRKTIIAMQKSLDILQRDVRTACYAKDDERVKVLSAKMAVLEQSIEDIHDETAGLHADITSVEESSHLIGNLHHRIVDIREQQQVVTG